jgi:hypothetical protein
MHRAGQSAVPESADATPTPEEEEIKGVLSDALFGMLATRCTTCQTLTGSVSIV